MGGEVELDELGGSFDNVEIVEVTGRIYRDRRRRSKRGTCEWTPSLRATTILIFIGIGIIYLIGVAIGVFLMFDSLEHLDMESSNTSINRLAMVIEGDIAKLQELTQWGTAEYYTGCALRSYNESLENPESTEEDIQTSFDKLKRKFYIKVANHENDSSFNCPVGVNYFAILNLELETLMDYFYPGDASALCGDNTEAPPPIIKPETYKNIISTDPDATGWLSMIIPDGGDDRPLIISLENFGIFPYGGDYDPNQYGYMVFGRMLLPRLNNGDNIADDVPTCITIENGKSDSKKWDKEDKKMFEKVTPGTVAPDKTYGGVPVFAQRSNEIITATSGRVCPAVPLFNSTSTLMVGYMKLCGLDPTKFGEHSCVKIRVDRPMSMVEEGTMPVVYLSLEVIAMMVILCIIFVIFLDCVVLRRIENLSNVIRSQTRGHARAQEEEDEKSVVMSASEEKHSEKHKSGKSGKSSGGKATSVSGTSETSSTSAASNASGPTAKAPAAATAHDEIGNLKRAMEQNAVGLRKRLEAVNDTIKIEQQKAIHHKQAMQLLNLWCGRKDFFPGLRPNAMQLRYEPTRSIDDVIENPLAIEYLKTHCDNESTLENLWFLLDVYWLRDLETAEDNEEDPVKRGQIHDIAEGAAKNIVRRYIVANAPQPINISSATYKKLREVGEVYSRKMFDEAVSEVKLMLSTDILPRFQKSTAYSAMSETLFIDSSGGGDSSSSEFSDETVSTVGSILTDDGSSSEGETNVGRLFAHTFKNLHQAFDVAHDDSSTYSNSAAGPTGSVIPDSQTETTTGHGAEERTKDDSSESSEKDPPDFFDDGNKDDKKEEKDVEEKPKKEIVESSESSSHSLSSDTMSESSSSSTAGISDASQ